jgi:hypothetical protein
MPLISGGLMPSSTRVNMDSKPSASRLSKSAEPIGFLPRVSLTDSIDQFLKQAQPRFQGKKATQLLNEGRLMKASQLKTAFSLDEDPYYGETPAALTDATGCSDTEVRQALEKLVLILKKEESAGEKEFSFPVSNDKAIQVQYVAEGSDGRVFRLTAGGVSYALKVFLPSGSGSAYQETANGAFFNAHNTSDVSRLYLSNPLNRWTLMEFVGPDVRLPYRNGKTMKEQQFSCDDETFPPNKINHILIDHGGALQVPEMLLMTSDLFQQKLIEVGLMSPVEKKEV